MIRILIFLLGLVLFAAGYTSDRDLIEMPIDFTSMTLTIGLVTVTADGILMGVGAFLIVIAIVFHKLVSGTV
jgi:hypothetical protein